MKIACWNVNGIRAAAKKGLLDWLVKEKPDVVCLQETKCHPDQLEPELREPLGYSTHWSSAKKKGYSGVALFLNRQALAVAEGLSQPEFDDEGRTLSAEFEDFHLITGYFPNGQPDLGRVPYKLRYSDTVMEYAHNLRKKSGKPVIICGDVNTAHREIDLARPKENEMNTGFLPQERAWVDKFIASGFVDIFRERTPDPHHYTWWSYRSGARPRNIGWRIDYFFISPELRDRVQRVYHQPEVLGSDHCPLILELKS
ncbi:MAG TPA: exodeoxyribonuclease III [bacterium]|nr:exodeoxyribonuclease III [bacterium]